MPAEYKKMQHFYDNECGVDKWIQVFDRIHKNNPECFFILYGGEPMVHPDIIPIVKYLKDSGYAHTIISNNSTKHIRDKIMELYNTIGTIPGFTASIDPELCLYLDNRSVGNDDSIKKTIAGFEYLRYLKKEGIADDVVAEITVSKSNINYLYRTVKILSDNDIWSSITTIDDQKSEYYDFSNVNRGSSLMVEPDLRTRLIFDEIQKDKSLKVHMPELLDSLYEALPANMKCRIHENIHNVTVDADQTFRLCLRIEGTNVSKIHVLDGIDSDGNVTQHLIDGYESDYKTYCRGCNHTCLMMSEKYANQIITH
jgi:MoaA/NifB/PqqE/SkfB family radical SAM enzyme